MIPRCLIVLAVIAVIATAAPLRAQQHQSAVGAEQAGGSQEQRSLGFVPAHEKRSTEPGLLDYRSPIRQTQRSSPVTIRRTSYADENAASESTPMPSVDLPADEAFTTPIDARVPDGRISNWWGRSEYLLWSTSGMNAPALATIGSTADPFPAVIGQPNTQVIFGNDTVNDDARSGGRFTIGTWLDPWQSRGFEASYLFLGQENTSFGASNSNFAVLGRPFVNAASGAADARLIANPGVVSGSLNIAAATEFQSLGLLFRQSQPSSCYGRFDFIIGYRLVDLDDRLRIDESTLALGGPLAGTTFRLFDQFDTRNTFHGGEFGVLWAFQPNLRWSVEALSKIAIGGTDHRADVRGQTTTTDTLGNTTTTQGGLLTQGTNIGAFRSNHVSTVSEFGVTLRRDLPGRWSATVGYTFIYWSNVVRAAEQIDTTVNPTQIPPGVLVGAARPAFPFRTTDFWAQGLNLGLECNY